MVAILMKDVFNLKEYFPMEDSRLAKSEFLHDEERRDESSENNEVNEAVTKEASLKLTAAAEETDDVHANKTNPLLLIFTKADFNASSERPHKIPARKLKISAL